MVILTTDELMLSCNERQADVGIAVSFIKMSDIKTAEARPSPNSTTISSAASAQQTAVRQRIREELLTEFWLRSAAQISMKHHCRCFISMQFSRLDKALNV